MKKQVTSATQGFVLPNLCADHALLLLLMAAELIVIAFVLFESARGFDWIYFGQVTLYVQWQVILSVLILCGLRPHLALLQPILAASTAYFVLILVAFAVAIMPYMLFDVLGFSWVLRNVLLTAILGGLALRYLYIQQQLIEREKSMVQASLVALQAKMRPHFLFNTMNSIASLITIDADKAEKMVEDLAMLLRASLRDNEAESTLAKEWALCERYLAIEQQRLGERLRWQCDFSQVDLQTVVPTFSLQPLIENAIYHGIQPYKEVGYINIEAWQQGGRFHLRVSNSKSSNAMPKTTQGNRLAISNIRLRLVKLYGDSAKLELLDHKSHFEAYMHYKNNKKVTT